MWESGRGRRIGGGGEWKDESGRVGSGRVGRGRVGGWTEGGVEEDGLKEGMSVTRY